MRRWLIVVGFLTLALACNFPGFPVIGPAQRLTPTVTLEAEREETEEAIDPEGEEGVQPSPAPLDTATPTGAEATTTPTRTPTVTSTETPTPTATPKPIVPGPPLAFQDPAWELIEWSRIPNTGDWGGTIRIRVDGGTAPYRSQLEDGEIVNGLDVGVRWRLCNPMPATIRVWSADDQYAQTAIWVPEVGSCD